MKEFYFSFDLLTGPIGRLLYIDYIKTRQVRSFILGDFFGAARALSLATEIMGIDVAFDNVSICQCIYLIDKCICGYDRRSRDPSSTFLNAGVHFNS